MTLGDIIKKYRKENNISMSEFASNCSLSKGYISMLENNVNPRNNKPISPTLPSIAKVASGMGIELDTLLKMMDNEQTINLASENTPTNQNSDFVFQLENSIGTIEMTVISNNKEQAAKRISRYIDFLVLYDQLSPSNKNKVSTYLKNLLSTQQMEEDLLAAHARTDVEQTPECVQHDLNIMNDDSKWEEWYGIRYIGIA